MNQSAAPHKQPIQFVNFLHAAPVAPLPRKKNNELWPIRAVMDEADRVRRACRHVLNPQPPQWLFGSRQEVEHLALAWHQQARKANGHRYQRNSPALTSCVVSFPQGRPGWPAYREATLAYFRKLYAERLAGAVEHTDENNPHLHIYLVPLPGEDFGVVHPGYHASRAERKKDNKVRSAFCGALKKWQDDFYVHVSQPHGLQRVGPRRKRLTRQEWLVADAQTKAKRKLEEAEAAAADLKRREDELNRKAREVRDFHEKLRDASLHLRKMQAQLAETPQAQAQMKIAGLEKMLAKVTQERDDALFRERIREGNRSLRGQPLPHAASRKLGGM